MELAPQTVSEPLVPTLIHHWDPSTFYGRFRHFLAVTDPTLVFVPNQELLASKTLIERFRVGNVAPGTTTAQLTRARTLYDSAFHPDTGELQNVAGRMCFNVYGSTVMCGGVMVFYKSNAGVFFWQWANQSFNALVNYTNRNAKSATSPKDIVVAYASAVTGALTVAFGLKRFFEKRSFGTVVQKMVPLAAVCAANFINIPLMRQNELRNGLVVTDENGIEVGESKLAAAKAIGLVALSRNIIVAPSMLLTPVIVHWLETNSRWFKRHARVLNVPLQLALVFVLFGAMVPVGCALFPQNNSISVSTLKVAEPDKHETFRKLGLDRVYFNKGL
ncbi:mitochondrial sideroflexin 2 [Aphelenchoides avenae]|nr:mitochondrial sideroflexin 2 [Aphelenchus avenae]